MRIPMRLLLASAAGLALAASLTVAAAPVGAANLTPQTRAGATATVAGTGHAVARSVSVHSSARISSAADSAGPVAHEKMAGPRRERTAFNGS